MKIVNLKKSKAMLAGGLLLIAAALCLAGYNLWDAHRAADSVESIIRGMQELTAEGTPETNTPDVSTSFRAAGGSRNTGLYP